MPHDRTQSEGIVLTKLNTKIPIWVSAFQVLLILIMEAW